MIRFNRMISILIITLFLGGILSSCYDRREIDDLAYIISIGIDKGKTNKLKMTLQIAVPKAIGGNGGGGGEGGNEAVEMVTLETPTIYSGMNMANNLVSRQLNISHTKLMVFSKEFAKEGMQDIINALPRGREARPSLYIAVSKGSAEEFIKAVNPKIEVNPAKYYELMFQSHKYTAFTARSDFYRFYTGMKALYTQPVAILAGVNRYESSGDFDVAHSSAGEKGRVQPLEGDFKAGSIPRESKLKSEIMGLAVFKGGKMVGELDGEETTFYTMVTGEFNRAFITIHDPIEKEKFVILDTKKSRRPQYKVEVKDNKPHITVRIKLEADIQVIQSGRNYEDTENTGILEEAYEGYVREGVARFLNRTAKEFESDICGFGKEVKAKMLTWEQWHDYRWLEKYKDSSFEVEVDLKIRRPGLVIRSSPIEK
ncbi:MAG: Ger(x)C family spore germination protein [Clostridia bacterium]|nr:Ger(x)C family spore germination protein [Clostridia bacterium]